jgi:argininosuccinate lyase
MATGGNSRGRKGKARPTAPASKAWGGRMAQATNRLVDAFTTSLPVDRRLYRQDIAGSIAHCRMLGRQRIISRRDASQIVAALRQIENEIGRGRFRFAPTDEDIHMAIERRLIERLGPLGGKLHTARSRNDQVATDLRLYLLEEIRRIDRLVAALQAALRTLARRYPRAILPGYTHLQPAQPILIAHHLLAYVEMLQRDRERLADCRGRCDVLPLGSGALAGTTFPIDRAYVAKLLGFRRISSNSMDAVSDRDFAVEFLAAAAILGMHLSRLAEEIVLWASQEFHFLELPDSFATGSSMMPQKKNPDVAELVRGRTGRLFGNLIALLTVLKGLPLSYNRDLQEDKAVVFDSADTIAAALEVLAAMLPKMRLDTRRMRQMARAGFTLATELADYLATKGVPFREAHGIVAVVVRDCLRRGKSLDELELIELQRFSPHFRGDVRRWLNLDAAVSRRRAPGGTSPANVSRALRRAPA